MHGIKGEKFNLELSSIQTRVIVHLISFGMKALFLVLNMSHILELFSHLAVLFYDSNGINTNIETDCGDNVYSAGETEKNYPLDCSLLGCGDGFCNRPYENVSYCYVDCFGLAVSENCSFITPQSNIQQGIISSSGLIFIL